MQVRVVGAGLAGLTAARHLAAEGADVIVHEQSDETGGRVQSRRQDGFVLDRGFQVLFTAYPAVQRELDVDALRLRTFQPGAVIASAKQRERAVVSDPIRDPGSLLPSLFNRRLTVGDKLRTLQLRWELTRRDESTLFEPPDVSIRTYLRSRGFSDRFIENFAAPFYGGITLDRSLSTSKAVFEYTFRCLATGRIGVPAMGMGAIPDQLQTAAETAGATIRTGETVTGIEPDQADTGVGRPGVTVETNTTTAHPDAVVVATDPPTARDLTGVESIPVAGRPSVTQYYALPEQVSLATERKLLLNADDARPNAIVPLSAVAPEYAPDVQRLICSTFLGADAVDASESDLLADTHDALSAWYPERRFDQLELITTDRVEFAQFSQPPGIHARLPDVKDPAGAVYLAGDYTEWSAIQGAMESGRKAARAVLGG